MSWRLCCLLALLARVCAPIIIADGDADDDNVRRSAAFAERDTSSMLPAMAAYRASVAKPQQAANRVPAHLQDIRAGFVYDDSDDVIHIIEPPQRFQLLKRRINQQQQQQQPLQQQKQHDVMPTAEAAVWEQQRQVRIARPRAAPVKEPSAKVEKPLRPVTRRKPVAAPVDADLLTQETRRASGGVEQALLHFPNQLPMEILASVRQTERLQQQQRRRQAPHAYQRLRTKQTHTLIMEKAYEVEKQQRGKERRMVAAANIHQQRPNRRATRTRRELPSQTQTALNLDTSVNGREKRKWKKSQLGMVKSKTSQTKQQRPPTASFAEKKHQRPKRAIEPSSTGDSAGAVQLLRRLNELLRNATHYLPDDDGDGDSNGEPTPATPTTTRLIGEVEDRTESLESGTNSTRRRCTGTRHRLQALDCVKSTPAPSLLTATKVFGQRLSDKVPRRLLPFIAAAAAQPPRRFKQRRGPARSGRHSSSVAASATATTAATTAMTTSATTLLSASLLYEDIMTNIRNMLEGHSFATLPDELAANASIIDATSIATNTTALATPLVPVNVSASNAQFRADLHQYLNELEAVVAHLPPPALALNTQEFLFANESAANSNTTANSNIDTNANSAGSAADWYLINGDGRIYEPQQLDATSLKPTASIFHRFPDIPSAEDHHSSTVAIL